MQLQSLAFPHPPPGNLQQNKQNNTELSALLKCAQKANYAKERHLREMGCHAQDDIIINILSYFFHISYLSFPPRILILLKKKKHIFYPSHSEILLQLVLSGKLSFLETRFVHIHALVKRGPHHSFLLTNPSLFMKQSKFLKHVEIKKFINALLFCVLGQYMIMQNSMGAVHCKYEANLHFPLKTWGFNLSQALWSPAVLQVKMTKDDMVFVCFGKRCQTTSSLDLDGLAL